MYDVEKTSQMITEFSNQYDYDEIRKKRKKRKAQTLDELKKQVMDELKSKAEEEDKIYDQEFEDMIAERLSKLNEESRREFYRVRAHRKYDGVLSSKEIDLLTLEAMEKSYYHYMGIKYDPPKYSKEFHFGG